MSETQFLTLQELCLKLRISESTARGMLKRGLLVGIKIPNRSWRIVDPGQRFEQYLRELDEHLVHTPLLSTAEVAELLGFHRIYIHELLRDKKLVPANREGGRKALFFTVAEVRRYMLKREKLNRPRLLSLRLELIVRWAKRILSEHHVKNAPEPTVPDEMAAAVDRILLLPEPERSRSLQALFLQLDRAELIVQAAQAIPTNHDCDASILHTDDLHTPETNHSPSLGQADVPNAQLR